MPENEEEATQIAFEMPVSPTLKGRRRIYSTENHCDVRNVLKIVTDALPKHSANA